MGWSTMNSIFLGGMLSMSSTMITIKAIEDLGLKEEKFTIRKITPISAHKLILLASPIVGTKLTTGPMRNPAKIYPITKGCEDLGLKEEKFTKLTIGTLVIEDIVAIYRLKRCYSSYSSPLQYLQYSPVSSCRQFAIKRKSHRYSLGIGWHHCQAYDVFGSVAAFGYLFDSIFFTENTKSYDQRKI